MVSGAPWGGGEGLQLQQALAAFEHNPLITNPFLEGSVVPLLLQLRNGELSKDRERRFKHQIPGIKTLNHEKLRKQS